ncbi:MAG: hypothetical protein Tsb009_37500 [Planctomycetaceae bacterium]
MATDIKRKEQLLELTDTLVESYHEIGTINHLGHCPLPSTEAVIEIAQTLKEILFPGYRRRQNLHFANVLYYVGDLVDSLHDQLTQQIARALRHDSDLKQGMSCEEHKVRDFEAEGQKKAIEFLETLPKIRQMLALDVQAAFDGDPAADSLDEIIFCYPGLEAVTIHRIAHELHCLNVPLILRVTSSL